MGINNSHFYAYSFLRNPEFQFQHASSDLNDLAYFLGEDSMKLSKKDLDVLPPRLIVTKILPFFSLEINYSWIMNNFQKFKSKLAFCLYGYFKKDHTRKLFYLFHSLIKCIDFDDPVDILAPTVESGDPNPFRVYVDFRKVENLVLLLKDKSTTFQLLANKHLPNLNRLVLGGNNVRFKGVSKILQRQSPNILKFLQFDKSRRMELSENQYFKVGKGIFDVSVLCLDQMRTIPKKLAKVKCLRKLYLSCSTGDDDPVPAGIKDLLSEHSVKCIKELNLNRVDVQDSFFKEKFESLETLTINKAPRVTAIGWRPLRKLKRLHIGECGEMKDVLFQTHDFPNLEELILAESMAESVNKGNLWNPLPNLRKLRLLGNFTDALFQKNSFPGLENLKICVGAEVTMKGEKWKPLRKLRKLHIIECLFEEKFFCSAADEVIPLLEFLIIENEVGRGREVGETQTFRGKWSQKLTRRLKFLALLSKDVSNEFFTENDFSNLRKFELQPNSTLDGKDWKMCNVKVLGLMFVGASCLHPAFLRNFGPNVHCLRVREFSRQGDAWTLEGSKLDHIRELYLEASNEIKDSFFAEKVDLRALQLLHIKNCRSLVGLDWQNLQALQNLTVSNCENLTDLFLRENAYGNLRSITVRNCPKIDVSCVGEWKREHNYVFESNFKSQRDGNNCTIL